MSRVRRLFITTLAGMAASLLAGCGGVLGSAGGEEAGASRDYPSDTVTILCSSEPGSPVDTMARTLADALKQTGFGQPVVVETRTGGDGAVALSSLASRPADGHTLYAMTRSQSVLLAAGAMDAVGPDDLAFVTRLQDDPYIWVAQADSQFKTMDDVVAWAKDNPGKLNVGGFGAKSAHQLAATRIAQEAGIETTWVPYEGGSEAVTALLGGHIDVANTNPGSVLEQVEAGKLRVLGVASEERIDGLDDVPTFTEQGINYVGSHWRGIIAKDGMPDEVLSQLEAALKKAYETSEFQNLLENQFVSPGYMPAEEFEDYVMQDIEDSKELLADVDE